MFGNNTRTLLPIILGSVFTSLFAICGLSVNVYAQDEPDYILGDLTFKKNLTKEETQEAVDKVTNFTNTMLKAANGNETKLAVLLTEDLAKRHIIDEKAKEGFISYIASLPKANVLPGTVPGNLTIPGNVTPLGNNTAFLKDLNASSALLDEIATNSSDSQTVTLMTDLLKRKGNVTDPTLMPFSDMSGPAKDYVKSVITVAVIAGSGTFPTSVANGYMMMNLLK